MNDDERAALMVGISLNDLKEIVKTTFTSAYALSVLNTMDGKHDGFTHGDEVKALALSLFEEFYKTAEKGLLIQSTKVDATLEEVVKEHGKTDDKGITGANDEVNDNANDGGNDEEDHKTLH